MVKYMKIVNYMCGDSISKQIQDIIDNGMMDKDTRLFFDSHNCVTMGDIKPLLPYFDITNNDEINNVVFVPNDYFIERFVENNESLRDKRW